MATPQQFVQASNATVDQLRDEMRRRSVQRAIEKLGQTNPQALETIRNTVAPQPAARATPSVGGVSGGNPGKLAIPNVTRAPSGVGGTPASAGFTSLNGPGVAGPMASAAVPESAESFAARKSAIDAAEFARHDSYLTQAGIDQRAMDAKYAAPAAKKPDTKALDEKVAERFALAEKAAKVKPDDAPGAAPFYAAAIAKLDAEIAAMATPAGTTAKPQVSKAITDSGGGSMLGNTDAMAAAINAKYGGEDVAQAAPSAEAMPWQTQTTPVNTGELGPAPAPITPDLAAAPAPAAGKQIVAIGKGDSSGKRYVKYSDGTTEIL